MLATMLDVMGPDEIRRRLGVSRQRVQQLVTRDDFPQPAKVLAAGKIWYTEDVERWISEHRPDLVGVDLDDEREAPAHDSDGLGAPPAE